MNLDSGKWNNWKIKLSKFQSFQVIHSTIFSSKTCYLIRSKSIPLTELPYLSIDVWVCWLDWCACCRWWPRLVLRWPAHRQLTCDRIQNNNWHRIVWEPGWSLCQCHGTTKYSVSFHNSLLLQVGEKVQFVGPLIN